MSYAIVPDYYVPKIKNDSFPELLHCVVYNRCNYNCIFCPKQYKKGKVTDYSPEEFEQKILKLMDKSNGFKFTGGEPTLNPRLEKDIATVKKYGGIVFLDTNGSNPDVVEKLLKKNLLDVVGISLKGINENEAKEVTRASGIKCWTNVKKTLEILSKADVTTILTYVVNDKLDIRSVVESLIQYVSNNNKFYLKINNYFLNAGGNDVFVPVNEEKLINEVNESVNNDPTLRGRVIVIRNKKAVSDGRYIAHL